MQVTLIVICKSQLMKNSAKLAKEYEESRVTHVLADSENERFIAHSLGYKNVRDVPHEIPILQYTWATDCVNVCIRGSPKKVEVTFSFHSLQIPRDPWLNLRSRDIFPLRFIPKHLLTKPKPAEPPKRRGTR